MRKQWRPIPIEGNENGKYIISNTGKVVNTHTGKKLKATLFLEGNRKPVMIVNIDFGNNKRSKRSLAQLVALTFVENPYDYTNVYHKDKNPMNAHAWNLAWIPSDVVSWLGTWNKGRRKNTGMPSIKAESPRVAIAKINALRKQNKEEKLLIEFYKTRNESALWQIYEQLNLIVTHKAKKEINKEEAVYDTVMESFLYFIDLAKRNLIQSYVLKKWLDCLEIQRKSFYQYEMKFETLKDGVESQDAGQYLPYEYDAKTIY